MSYRNPHLGYIAGVSPGRPSSRQPYAHSFPLHSSNNPYVLYICSRFRCVSVYALVKSSGDLPGHIYEISGFCGNRCGVFNIILVLN